MKQKHVLPVTYFLVLFLYNFSAGFAHPVTPTLVVDRALPSQWYGYAMSAVSIGSFAIAPFWGKLCNYVSTRKMAIFGFFGYILGQSIMCTAYSGLQLVIGRVTAGMLAGASSIALLNYIMNIGDLENRPKYLTIYATAGSVCNAAGYFVGGMLGMISIEAAFIGQGIVLLTCAVLGFFFLEDDTPYKFKPETSLNIKDVNPFSAFLDAKNFMTPMLFVFFASFISVSIGMSAFENAFNYYIKDNFGLGSQYNGTIKAIIAIGGLAVNSTLGMWLIKKTNVNYSMIPVAIVQCMFVSGSMLFFQSMLPLSAMFICYSIMNIIYIPITQNLAADRSTPQTSNSLMGFYQSMRSFGGVIGSFIEANLYAMNSHFAFQFAAGTILLGVLLGIAYSGMYTKAMNER